MGQIPNRLGVYHLSSASSPLRIPCLTTFTAVQFTSNNAGLHATPLCCLNILLLLSTSIYPFQENQPEKH